MISDEVKGTFSAYLTDVRNYAELRLVPNTEYQGLIKCLEIAQEFIDHAKEKQSC